MIPRHTRRSVLTKAAVLPLALSLTTSAEARTPRTRPSTSRDLRALEPAFGVRLGVFAVDTATGRTVTHRSGERFAFCSTAKALSSGLLIRDADLERRITFTAADVVSNSPVTSQHVGTGMTIRELCDAALRFSDNTAANLVVGQLGGPAALTRRLRRIGDGITRADRLEPQLNSAIPGQVLDTTTPRAIAVDLGKLLLGRVLPDDRREVLRDLMRRNTTGDLQIRAGVPGGWTVADKTGSGEYGTKNDIAVAWPPGRRPIVLSVMTTKPGPTDVGDVAVIARATEIVVRGLG